MSERDPMEAVVEYLRSVKRQPASPDEEAWDEAAYQEQESVREPIHTEDGTRYENDSLRRQRHFIRNGLCPWCSKKLPPSWPGHDTVKCECGAEVMVRI